MKETDVTLESVEQNQLTPLKIRTRKQTRKRENGRAS
jgi:hypothetical protein